MSLIISKNKLKKVDIFDPNFEPNTSTFFGQFLLIIRDGWSTKKLMLTKLICMTSNIFTIKKMDGLCGRHFSKLFPSSNYINNYYFKIFSSRMRA
jgi:hypothetical protein